MAEESHNSATARSSVNSRRTGPEAPSWTWLCSTRPVAESSSSSVTEGRSSSSSPSEKSDLGAAATWGQGSRVFKILT